ncbi:adenylyl-sulfate kinase [Paraburkholderia sp. SIMBA_030]|uniref:adenylyl-sulfate kinase n=1 Tax=Paraburkholderia sp. SIMBA_030 TaxID=3085773 RepID=UPI00397D358A
MSFRPHADRSASLHVSYGRPSAAPEARQEDVYSQSRENPNAVIWLTGLSGAGKSTLGHHVRPRLEALGYRTYLLDGDVLRTGLNADLGFSASDRSENVRRTAHVANLMADSGLLVLVAAIAPFAADRAKAREVVGKRLHEVFVAADLETCRRRDPKGLYARAFNGEILNFTGVDSPYEPPEAPDLLLDTGKLTLDACSDSLVDYIMRAVPLRSASPPL